MNAIAKAAAVGILCAIIGIGLGNVRYQIAGAIYKSFATECTND